MTIDEAILFCDWKSKNIKLKTEPDTFVQIATWLRELKELREMVKCEAFSDGYEKGRADAIDEFASMLIADLGIAGYTKDTRSGHETYMCYELLDAVEELRERLINADTVDGLYAKTRRAIMKSWDNAVIGLGKKRCGQLNAMFTVLLDNIEDIFKY